MTSESSRHAQYAVAATLGALVVARLVAWCCTTRAHPDPDPDPPAPAPPPPVSSGPASRSQEATTAAPAEQPLPRRCHHCGAEAPKSRCSRCKVAWFCNAACQKSGMKAHREECLRIHLEMMTEECKRHVNRMCYPEAAAAGRAGIESARKLKDPISEAKCHGLVGVAVVGGILLEVLVKKLQKGTGRGCSH